MAGAKARKIERATLALNTAKWKSAIGATSLDGRRAAPNGLTYRWVKGLTGWTPSCVATNSWEDKGQAEDNPRLRTDEHHLTEMIHGDFDIPLSDQAVVDKEAEDWATLWQETTEYTPPQFECEPHTLHPMLESDIRAAAESFPPNTGLGADGFLSCF